MAVRGTDTCFVGNAAGMSEGETQGAPQFPHRRCLPCPGVGAGLEQAPSPASPDQGFSGRHSLLLWGDGALLLLTHTHTAPGTSPCPLHSLSLAACIGVEEKGTSSSP